VRSEGAEAFAERLVKAAPLSGFLFDELARPLDLSAPDGRARLVALAEPLLSRLPAGPFADLMAEELKRRAGHSGSWKPAAARQLSRISGSSERPLTPVQYAVAILVQYPELVEDAREIALDVPGELKGARFLARLIDFCTQKPQITTAQVLEHWRGAPEGRFLSGLATRDLAGGIEQLRPALVEALERIHAQLVRSRIGQLQQCQSAGGLNEQQAAELRHWLSKRTTGNAGSNEKPK